MNTLFETKLDIPAKHLQMMIICNSVPFPHKQQFYSLKHKILSEHGRADGYDLQIIVKKMLDLPRYGKIQRGRGLLVMLRIWNVRYQVCNPEAVQNK